MFKYLIALFCAFMLPAMAVAMKPGPTVDKSNQPVRQGAYEQLVVERDDAAQCVTSHGGPAYDLTSMNNAMLVASKAVQMTNEPVYAEQSVIARAEMARLKTKYGC